MKITISVMGRFHAFDLARQLQKRGVLHRLITSYPKFKAMEWDIPKNKITSILSNELLNRGLKKIPNAIKFGWDHSFYLHNRFDKLASSQIPADTDIFIGWSGSAYHSLCKAKHYGAITFLERGSAHILFQSDILTEEYNKFNLHPKTPHPEIIDQELREYKKADYISIPSQFVKETFLKNGISSKKLLVNPYGVEISNFYPIEKTDNNFRVIHCGGITLQKGVPYLLQAFYELNLKDAELWLIGNVTPEIKYFLNKYRAPNIILKGTFPQSELYKLYSQGSVFCLFSIQEGLGMVIPQAMACGLPVICSTNTGGGEIVKEGENGFIIPIRDVESLKEKLLFLYKNPIKCKKMGVAALNDIKNGHSWKDYGNIAAENYSQLLNSQ